MAAASTLCGGLVAKSADALNGTVLALCTATALALQVFSNFANDYGDPPRRRFAAAAGAGAHGGLGPHQPKPACARAWCWAVLFRCACGIAALLAGGAARRCRPPQPAVWLLWLLLGAAAIAAAFGYTAGRKP